MWTRIENKHESLEDKEDFIGSAFVDIQSLIGQRRNSRLKYESLSVFNSYDGYYTMAGPNSDVLLPDRLGLSTLLLKKDYASHKDDLSSMFHTFHTQMRSHILQEYDLNLKGTIEYADLDKVLQKFLAKPEDVDMARAYVDC